MTQAEYAIVPPEAVVELVVAPESATAPSERVPLREAASTRERLPPLEIERFLGPPPLAPRRDDPLYQLITRGLDIIISLGVLVVALPLLVAVAVAIRLDSPGPALHRGRRVRFNRRHARAGPWQGPERRSRDGHAQIFHLFKFRTMYVDAHIRFPAHYAYAYTEAELRSVPMKTLKAAGSGPEAGLTGEHAIDIDPRVTRIGRWLRRTSIDELPNLFNVLRGDMSLVGGRPDAPALAELYIPEHRRKFDLKPGVTGLAQVLGRGNLTFHQINAYDTEYVEHHSIRLYFWILWRTAVVVCTGEGAF